MIQMCFRLCGVKQLVFGASACFSSHSLPTWLWLIEPPVFFSCSIKQKITSFCLSPEKLSWYFFFCWLIIVKHTYEATDQSIHQSSPPAELNQTDHYTSQPVINFNFQFLVLKNDLVQQKAFNRVLKITLSTKKKGAQQEKFGSRFCSHPSEVNSSVLSGPEPTLSASAAKCIRELNSALIF